MSFGNNYQQEIMKRVLILMLILSGIILMTFSNPKQYVYGLVFGSVINVLNFRLMALSLEKSIYKSPDKITIHVMGNYIIRYMIYGIVLSIAAIADYISLLTVILGFFMVKLVIVSDTLYDTLKGTFKKKEGN